MIEFVNKSCGWNRISPKKLRQKLYRDISAWKEYSTAKNLTATDSIIVRNAEQDDLGDGLNLQIEILPNRLTERWKEKGIYFATYDEIEDLKFTKILRHSLDIIRMVEPLIGTVSGLCRSLHVLKSPGAGFDSSYSEPILPFSIFVSCPLASEKNRSERLAENIVHEALHLQLSLVEKVEPLILNCHKSSKIYSPWKDEWRPVQGVLHSVYVFGNLLHFWKYISKQTSTFSSFAEARISRIENELTSVRFLAGHPALTPIGRRVAISLLAPWLPTEVSSQ